MLDALRGLASVRVAVMVTTDKVYRDMQSRASPTREDDPLGGHDPYSASKAASEIVDRQLPRVFPVPRKASRSRARAPAM